MSRRRRTMWARSTRLAFAVIFLLATSARAQEIRVAAAADLRFALSELASQYEKQAGTKVNVTYGSSGNFFAQIQNGAPFDLFFSADLEYPRKLEAAGLAESGTLFVYARGRIVIWTRRDVPIDVATQDWNALLSSTVEKIAIANPAHAPYGRAAVAALKNAGIFDQVKSKLVYGENISQAAQFVQSGNAQAGIVALSLALSPPMQDGKRWEIPAAMHPAIEQCAILLKSATNKAQARAFLEFIKTPEARATFEKFGFMTPEANAASARKP
ncbi:MAG: molybdate ABC transporter substrate-binding protein [Candidatus Acidiferrales bacterium]